MWRRLIATSPTWITMPLRLALGVIFAAHGMQKVFGAFGGKGLAAFTSGQTPFGFMQPAWLWLGIAALSELIGGVLVLLGFVTRLGALLIAFVMLTAMFGVHFKGGFFMQTGGFEYTYALLGICIALLISGGGQASVDKTLAAGGRGGGRRRYSTHRQ